MPPTTPHIPKKIILCCDGTWNQPERTVDDRKHQPTNVLKLTRALLAQDGEGRHQVVYYDTGVGTDRGLYDRFIGGALGLGLSAHIKKAYRFLANNFQEGDELYCFGFSRGAYSVRALAGMIGAVGLLHPRDIHHLPLAYRYYRTPPAERKISPLHEVMGSLQRRTIPIKFMGVWDTVGALGVPIPLIQRLSQWRVGFFNTELGHHIQYAYQALAIDERRRPFAPDLWQDVEHRTTPEGNPLYGKDRKVLQVWFPGAHSNIGGGYPDPGLSDVAFTWLMNRAREHGLAFDEQFLKDPDRINPNPYATLYPSPSKWWKLLSLVGIRPYDRSIGEPANDSLKSALGIHEMIHESVWDRLNPSSHNVPIPAAYTPLNFTKVERGNMPIFRERRRPRLHGNWSASLITTPEGNAIDCQVLDLSQNTGVRILCHTPLPTTNAPVWLESIPLRLNAQRAHIVWSDRDQAGLEFATGERSTE